LCTPDLNKHRKTKPKAKTNTQVQELLMGVCVSLCTTVVLSNRTQHRTVLIIFPLILRAIVIAHMMSTGGEGVHLQKAALYHMSTKTSQSSQLHKTGTTEQQTTLVITNSGISTYILHVLKFSQCMTDFAACPHVY